MGISVYVSINPIGSVTSAPAAIDAFAPIVKTITNAAVFVAPVEVAVTPATAELPPTGANAATLSALNAQLDNTNNSSGLLPTGANGWQAQSYAAVALLSGTTAVQPVYDNPTRPAIAPIEPLGRSHARDGIDIPD